MSDPPILIAGGGLGGLTTALALARRGRAVRVLEGAPGFGAIGYGIQFGPNVFQVFDWLGISADVLRDADQPPGLTASVRSPLNGSPGSDRCGTRTTS